MNALDYRACAVRLVARFIRDWCQPPKESVHFHETMISITTTRHDDIYLDIDVDSDMSTDSPEWRKYLEIVDDWISTIMKKVMSNPAYPKKRVDMVVTIQKQFIGVCTNQSKYYCGFNSRNRIVNSLDAENQPIPLQIIEEKTRLPRPEISLATVTAAAAAATAAVSIPVTPKSSKTVENVALETIHSSKLDCTTPNSE